MSKFFQAGDLSSAAPGAAAEAAIVTGGREQLLHLLAEAAEIEHTLMCSYLYTAFSLRRAGEGQLSDLEGKAVARWRRVIMGIATEEMGHLLMVANLTVAVGGSPHFARPNFPIAPGYFPSEVRVKLSGFSQDTLEHFIFLERPEATIETDSPLFEQEHYMRTQRYSGLMPSAQDYQTIGHLYHAIGTNLTELTDNLGEEGALFVGEAQSQIGPDVIKLAGLKPITDLQGALSAIDLIVEQGEGSSSDREDSHYHSFRSVHEELLRLQVANASFSPAWPVADNPMLRSPPDPADKVFIDDPVASRVLDFACATYGLLLRLLVQCFGRSSSERALQKQFFATALDLMHILAEACDALARLPASSVSPGVNAGMTFTMLRGVEPLISGNVERMLIQEQLIRLAAGAASLPGTLSGMSPRLRSLAKSIKGQ